MTYIAKNTPDGVVDSQPEKMEKNQSGDTSFFDQLSPKSAMVVGLVGGIMTLCTVGFIILLTIFFKGGFLI